jgi:two-component system C4-dicarboxylate transport response regulator DctD
VKRLLVIDDDASAVEALCRLLRLDGYEVTGHEDPMVALAALRAGGFDALVTDLEMPRVHGVELVRVARVQRSGMPVYVVSAYTDSPAALEAIAAGASRVFAKPLDYDALADDLAARLAAEPRA